MTMAPSHFVDIHPHIIAADESRYPRNPLFGVQSNWSRERPITIEQYIAAMDEAGVQQAAIVQASTCYGYDNSYLTDCHREVSRPIDGGRVGRSVAAGRSDADSKLDAARRDRASGCSREAAPRRSIPARSTIRVPSRRGSCARRRAFSICLQTDPTGLAQVAGLAKRFPKVKIILDHLSRPDISDGPPYKKASSLFGLQPFENIHLKLTPRTVDKATAGRRDAGDVSSRG